MKMKPEKITLSVYEQIGFGLGHIFNDIVASVWFAYTLIFYKLAVGTNGYILVVSGQVVDCIATMFIGCFFDSENGDSKFFKNGKYMTWYMIGMVFALLAFIHCFLELPFMIENKTRIFFTYLLSGFVAQIGWTFCQISHLTLMNVLSVTSGDRIRLTALRQGGSIYGAVVVFAFFWYTLAESETRTLGKEDLKLFGNNVFWLCNFGIIHSLLFIYMVDEPALVKRKQMMLTNSIEKQISYVHSWRKMDAYSKKDWLMTSSFYVVMLIFMFSRLYQNLLFTYVPLYLQYFLYMTKETIAIVPLIIYLTGFLCSCLANYIENWYGNQMHIFIGIVVGFFAHLFIGFGSCHSYAFTHCHIFIIAILLGISTTTIKIASMSIVGEMIGHNRQCTSFVYAMVSLADKSLGGVAIGVLEQFNHNDLLTSSPSSSALSSPSYALNGTPNVLLDTSDFCPQSAYPPVTHYYNINFLGNEVILFAISVGVLLLTRCKFE